MREHIIVIADKRMHDFERQIRNNLIESIEFSRCKTKKDFDVEFGRNAHVRTFATLCLLHVRIEMCAIIHVNNNNSSNSNKESSSFGSAKHFEHEMEESKLHAVLI